MGMPKYSVWDLELKLSKKNKKRIDNGKKQTVKIHLVNNLNVVWGVHWHSLLLYYI